jgi:hypothetical protein
MALAVIVACGATDDGNAHRQAASGIPPRSVAGCEAESFKPCDVTDASCQQALFATVACIRGDVGATRPPSRTITAKQYGEELTRSANETSTSADAESFDADEVAAFESGLELLHLAKPGDLAVASQISLLTSTVPAYYDPESKNITFVTPDAGPAPDEDDGQYYTLAHEYTHALQDQAVDLVNFEKRYGKTLDSALAVHALIEGEAEIYEAELLAASWGQSLNEIDWEARIEAQRSFHEQALIKYPPYLGIWRSFPYDAGTPFVLGAFRSGGPSAVRALFGKPPTATASVTNATVPDPITTLPAAPPEGYVVLAYDTFGSELFRYYLAGVSSFTPAERDRIVADWRGDRVSFYYRPNSMSVAVLWRLRFASSETTARLSMLLGAHATLLNGDLLLSYSNPSGTDVATTLVNNETLGILMPAPSSADPSTPAANDLIQRIRRSLLLRRLGQH